MAKYLCKNNFIYLVINFNDIFSRKKKITICAKKKTLTSK